MGNQGNLLQLLFNEGSELLQAGRAEEALLRFQAALNSAPSNATLQLHAGAALHDLGRYAEAVTSYRKAADSAPGMGEVHNNLGNSLLALGRFTEAVASFSRASELLPSSPVPLAAKATALLALGNVAEAEADCRRALVLDPAFAAAHWNLALNLLLQGKYIEGWQEYEWRWLKPGFTSPSRHRDTPLWDGSRLQGRTILLHAEQGFGDAIQFVRYASQVAGCGGTVVVECHPQLVSLFKGIEGVQMVVPFGEPLPPFSCHSPLLSLPRIFETRVDTIPSRIPYISISLDQREKWETLTGTCSQSLRIGLVWAGKSYPDPLRTCRLEDLDPLATVQNVTFYSLQLGPGAEQVGFPPAGMTLVDLTDKIHDFADTAALIEQLDIVICIDTAVAHLAGALGKPVFLMLPLAPDWRWLIDRIDSPWYPSMQLFRQKRSGDWGEVVDRVHVALKEFADKNKKSFEAAPKDFSKIKRCSQNELSGSSS